MRCWNKSGANLEFDRIRVYRHMITCDVAEQQP